VALVPDGARRRVTNDEFDAIEFPDGYEPAMQVHLDHLEGSPAHLVDAVSDVMREWGRSEVGWWLTPCIPTEYASAIRALTGSVAERHTVLAGA